VRWRIGRADGPHIAFRIGINVGDIILDGGDIFGDGVNVAARVEGECEPGGVCLSDDAFRHVRSKTSFAFDDMGERTLKNIERPVRIYAVRPSASSSATEFMSRVDVLMPPLPPPAKPSIAVLPFTNMSGDPEQEYFADGMVEDIITALSRFKSLFVIARNSSFTYKGRAVDVKQVGRELGVRYVLEGSVRKAKNVRITGQLIEAETNRHIWADKFDGAIEDVFELQDKITSSVVGLIAPQLEFAEIERTKSEPTESLDSYDFYLRGAASFYQKAPVFDALRHFRKAIERDPEFAAPYAMAAFMFQRQQADSGLMLSGEERAEAINLARRGARLATGDAFTLARSGHVLTYRGHEYDRGSALVDQAVTLNPNLAIAWYSRGWVALMSDQFDKAIESFERMIRLSPIDPSQAHALAGIALAHFNLERHEEGCASAMKAVQFAVNVHTLGAYIMNSVRAGRAGETREAVAQLLELHPAFRPTSVQIIFPIRSTLARARMLSALRDAGLPE
jgi:TolB-like protein